MATAISTAAAAILETRERRLAAVCVMAGWVACTVALATVLTVVSLNPLTYGGAIGAAVGMFLGAFGRESSKGMRHAFTVATLRAGSFAAACIAAVLVALALHPVLGTDGLEAMLGFGLAGFALIVLGGWLWERRDQSSTVPPAGRT